MIHSDVNIATGIGKVSLESGLFHIGISPKKAYRIGLVGGQSDEAIRSKAQVIKQILPLATIVYSQSNVDSAYFIGFNVGLMFTSKKEICHFFEVDQVMIDLHQNEIAMKDYNQSTRFFQSVGKPLLNEANKDLTQLPQH